MTIKPALENKARELGFAAFGVAPVDYDPVAHNAHLRWLDKGYQGSMAYLERGPRQRFDPKIYLPDANSVIVCAMNYYSDPQDDPDKPYISIYARGENYHVVLRDKLEALCARMRDLAPKSEAKIFVDSSPIAEKAFAVKAGLGFIGRNAMLILPKKKSGRKTVAFGSFYFLGVVITNLRLEPDEPGIGTCGQCRKCIEACPTEAIVGDGVVDATRCISYHTTQNKGELPDDVGSAMGNMIFGCDICQMVCPYNSGATATEEPRLSPNPALVAPALAALLDITDREFRARFAKSSIGEVGPGMFRRNVRTAAGNLNGGK
jgi:epoxyqueuosine reductase